MTRIGIMTLHKAYNYGAVLQCYSLTKLLQSKFPECTVEVIDFCSKKLMGSYSNKFFVSLIARLNSIEKLSIVMGSKVIIKSALDYLQNGEERSFVQKRNVSISEFQKCLPLSSIRVVGNEQDFVNTFQSRYDIIVVGSDAIWNDKQVELPNVYYLGLIKKCVKLSYAASSYGMDYELLSKTRKDFVRVALNDFCYIGVRDAATDIYVKNIRADVTPEHNCDPSLFLDLEALPVSIDNVKYKFREKGVDISKPIIGLMCSDWQAKAVRYHLGDRYQYVALYNWNGYADYYMDNLTPFEWALSFRLFCATFTHFFHGTLFSLKNHTPTYAIEKKSSYSKKYTTKIADALSRMELMDHYFVFEDMTKDTWNSIRDSINKGSSPDYICRIDKGIRSEIQSNSSFLRYIGNAIKDQ